MLKKAQKEHLLLKMMKETSFCKDDMNETIGNNTDEYDLVSYLMILRDTS